MAKSGVDLQCRILVIGGSAGSLEVLLRILRVLKGGFKFPFVVILHRGSPADSVLAELLTFKTRIPIREIEDKEPIQNGVIYLAPSNYHVLIETENEFSLDYSEKVNYSRPSIDVTFMSAADVFGKSTVGILLSGANDDGTNGLKAIAAAGGTTVVQDPKSAKVSMMPQNAIDNLDVRHIIGDRELGEFINSLNS
jgi:two-component system chemotaxis response regulator CheB